jgi:hypothetical protein
MGNRCPSCEKFVALEVGEPQVESCDVSADGNGVAIEVTVRLLRICAECGEEMRATDTGETESFNVEELRAAVSGDGAEAFQKMLNDAGDAFRDDIEIDWEADESGDAEAHEDVSEPVGRQRKGRPCVAASIGVTVRATYRKPLPADAPANVEEPEDTTVEFGLSVEVKEDFDSFEECC